MAKLATKLILTCSLFALISLPSQARHRGANFFEDLFGIKSQAGSAPDEFDPYGDKNPLEKRVKKKRSAKTTKQNGSPKIIGDGTADADFKIEGLGLGVVAYKPPLLLPLYDAKLASLTTYAAESEAIRQLLADKKSPLRASENERNAILAFYKSNLFSPLWVSQSRLRPRTIALLATLSSSEKEGLSSKNYLPEVLSDFTSPEVQIVQDAKKQARLDIGISLAALRYARHMTAGQFEPNRLSLYNDIKPEVVDADEAMFKIAKSADPVAYLQTLAPKHPQYAILKAELEKLNQPNSPSVNIAFGPRVKTGKRDERIPVVRQRLIELGFLDLSALAAENQEILDQDVSIALMALQTANKLKPRGNLDDATIKILNRDDSASKREKIMASLERLKWLPDELGNRHVFVNQAGFNVRVMENGNPKWESRVIVGQTTTQTHSFYDEIQTVVFNPTWGVPASIIVNEYGPKMRKDPKYLDRNGFEVTDFKGNIIKASSVDWQRIGPNPKFGVRQKSGDGNALGEMKFIFPNAHDIYMHDTPTKNLFSKDTRAFSHGCVRVENPRDFAEALLNWDNKKITNTLATKKTQSVPLSEEIPVYLTYFTAWADDSGKIHYNDDIYGRDSAFSKALAYDQNISTPLKPKEIVAQSDNNKSIIQN